MSRPPRFEMPADVVDVGYQLVSLVREQLTVMQTRWDRQPASWRAGTAGEEATAFMETWQRLTDEVEEVLPVNGS